MRARQPHPPRYDATAAQRLRPFPGARGWDRTNAWIFMGSIGGARKSRERKGSIICPLDIDPFAFRWPVSGLYGVLVRTDDERKEKAIRLVQAFLRDGAEMVCVLTDDAKTSFHYAAHRSGINEEGIEE
jgi:hypothetical protein